MDLKPINLVLPESVRTALNSSSENHQARFALNAKEDDEPAELLVMGIVGDKYEGIGADQVVRQLSEMKGRQINVRINSPGGLAYDGLTIFNALIQHEGGVTTTVEGMAGSAASIIAMAGNPVRMMANANLFIHRSMGLAFGNALIMRDVAEFLDALDEGIVETYVAKTGLSKRRVNALMDGKVDGTNFTAKEAKSLGFADEIVELKRPKKQASNTTSTAETLGVMTYVVPEDPHGGEGGAVTATWEAPTLAAFTSDEWEHVGPNTRAAIARHYAVVPEDLEKAEFGELLLPHHDPETGKPNAQAVREAIDGLLDIPEGHREAAGKHLRAHVPQQPEPKPFALSVEQRKRLIELRLEEVA